MIPEIGLQVKLENKISQWQQQESQCQQQEVRKPFRIEPHSGATFIEFLLIWGFI